MKIRYLLLHAYGMGGTIRTVLNQAGAMAALGHQVEVVSVVRRRERPHFPFDPRVIVSTLVDQREGIGSDSVARKAWRRVRGKIVPPGEYAADYFSERVEKAVIDYVSGLEDGVLVTTRPALNLIAARRGSPKVVRLAQEHMNLGAYKEPVRQEIERHYGKLDAVTVLTKDSQEEYRLLLPGTPIVHIPNAIHTADPRTSQQEHPVLVTAGRLVPQKGFDLLIEAFSQVAGRHADWRLRVFGTGPRRAELKAQIDEHGLGEQVLLMGKTRSMDEELAKASIYVLSSRFEGLPMVMIEAMTHALPVVAFDCPTGPADVLTDGVDGVLVPPQDTTALAAALDRLMSDREQRLRMGAAALVTSKAYSAEMVMPLWEDLFAELQSGERISDDYWPHA